MIPDRIVPLRAAEGPLPLYCVHPGSGSVYPYLPLVRLIGPEQAVYGLEAPGYDDGGMPVTQLTELSDMYNEAIALHADGQPVCLLGWSLGGAVAHDMAWRAQAAGRPVAMVILLDTIVPEPEPLPPTRQVLALFVTELAGGDAGLRRELDTVLAGRPPEESAEDAFQALSEAGLLPGEFDAEMLSERFTVFHAHTRALHRYRAPEGYPGPVVSIRAEHTPSGAKTWADVALDVEEHTVPGDHYSMWRGDGLGELSDIVRRSLLRARALVTEGRAR